MANEIYYPVQKLNRNITQFLAQIVSSDILGNLESGLENEIQLIDIGEHITDIASIGKNPFTGHSEVRLSMAYCQYFWFISDIALKILDHNIIEESCMTFNMNLDDFKKQAELIKSMSRESLQLQLSNFPGLDAEQFVAYFHSVSEILESDFWQQMAEEYKHAISIITPDMDIDLEAIQSYDLGTKYHERVNSVYCYGIAFILLHELYHHALGHMGKPDKDGDEENADMSAFWSIFTDVTGDNRISANASFLFVFFSYMELDPKLTEDGIHPRDDKRLFAIYDLIKNEHPKYTAILVRLLDFWAKTNSIEDYPIDLPCEEDSVEKIKAFFESMP